MIIVKKIDYVANSMFLCSSQHLAQITMKQVVLQGSHITSYKFCFQSQAGKLLDYRLPESKGEPNQVINGVVHK
jgi:hypothetical protein